MFLITNLLQGKQREYRMSNRTESEAVKEVTYLWRKLLSKENLMGKRHLDYDKHVYALAFLLNQLEREKEK